MSASNASNWTATCGSKACNHHLRAKHKQEAKQNCCKSPLHPPRRSYLQHAINVPALVWGVALNQCGDLSCEVWLELAVTHCQVVQQLTRQVAAAAAGRAGTADTDLQVHKNMKGICRRPCSEGDRTYTASAVMAGID
jgi:hypothetical protein